MEIFCWTGYKSSAELSTFDVLVVRQFPVALDSCISITPPPLKLFKTINFVWNMWLFPCVLHIQFYQGLQDTHAHTVPVCVEDKIQWCPESRHISPQCVMHLPKLTFNATQLSSWPSAWLEKNSGTLLPNDQYSWCFFFCHCFRLLQFTIKMLVAPSEMKWTWLSKPIEVGLTDSETCPSSSLFKISPLQNWMNVQQTWMHTLQESTHILLW